MTTTSVLVSAPAALSMTIVTGTIKDDRMEGTSRNEMMFGLKDDDRMSGEDGNDSLFGGEGDDRVSGGEGHDFLKGDSGDDRLDGDDGNDFLYGGRGNDRLGGGSGDDYLRAHGGIDFITGGSGADKFVFSSKAFGTTTIDDFQDESDRLIFYKEGTDLGTFREFMARATQVGADTVYDNNGFKLILLGVDRADLTSADFFNPYL